MPIPLALLLLAPPGIDLSALTLPRALALEGRPAVYLVTVDSLPATVRGRTCYDAAGEPSLYRTVRLPREASGPAVRVYGVLRVIRHPAGHGYPPVTELRVVGREVR